MVPAQAVGAACRRARPGCHRARAADRGHWALRIRGGLHKLALHCKVLFMPTPVEPSLATSERPRAAYTVPTARSRVRSDAPPATALLWQAALLGLSGDA